MKGRPATRAVIFYVCLLAPEEEEEDEEEVEVPAPTTEVQKDVKRSAYCAGGTCRG